MIRSTREKKQNNILKLNERHCDLSPAKKISLVAGTDLFSPDLVITEKFLPGLWDGFLVRLLPSDVSKCPRYSIQTRGIGLEGIDGLIPFEPQAMVQTPQKQVAVVEQIEFVHFENVGLAQAL